jgi:hypothetical protein
MLLFTLAWIRRYRNLSIFWTKRRLIFRQFSILIFDTFWSLTKRRFKIRCYPFYSGFDTTLSKFVNLLNQTQRNFVDFDDFRFLTISLFIPKQTQIKNRVLLFYYGFDTTLSKFVNLWTKRRVISSIFDDFDDCSRIRNDTVNYFKPIHFTRVL